MSFPGIIKIMSIPQGVIFNKRILLCPTGDFQEDCKQRICWRIKENLRVGSYKVP